MAALFLRWFSSDAERATQDEMFGVVPNQPIGQHCWKTSKTAKLSTGLLAPANYWKNARFEG